MRSFKGKCLKKHKELFMPPKKIAALVKLQVSAGKANPAPPVGPALGQHGVNIMDFCKQFNAKTSDPAQDGLIIPVVITVYVDRSFTFIMKTPPVSVLLKRAIGLAKGSGEPNKTKVGKITKAQIKDIALLKMPDLNTTKIDSTIRMVEGTARNMGHRCYGVRGLYEQKTDELKKKVDAAKNYSLSAGAALIKEVAKAKFDESVT